MAEYSFDLTPDIVNFTLYSGDTLAFEVVVDDNFTDGMEWLSQIRDARSTTEVAAEFTITTKPEGADMLLPGAVTGALTNQGVILSARQIHERYPALDVYGAEKMLVFVGVWDVQVTAPYGADPIVTLAHGELVIGLDVSREAP
jgi:hypothetical protein